MTGHSESRRPPAKVPHSRGAAREPQRAAAAIRLAASREVPLVLMLSAAHPPTDLRVVGKEGAALAGAGWRVAHLAPAPLRGAKDVPQEMAGVEILTYPRVSGWIGRLRAARTLARRAAKLKPAVIHAHEPDSWYAAILAARMTGAAVVLDVHEHYPSRLDTRLPGMFRGLGRRAVIAACRWMAARADAVVVAKDGLEDAFPEAEVVPVRNYAAEVPVAPRQHRHGPLTLVHLGALTRERGAFEMLRALARCPEGTRLSLIGRFTDNSETEFLSEAKRLGVAGAVERHGWLPHEAAVALAAEADIGIVLFQPGHENHRLALPHKLFDCMLAGLPVVVPNFAEEVAEVVRETGCGVLVNTADPDTVAEAVRALADPDLRAEMGAAGRAAALGRYGWAGEAARLVALYEELAPLPVPARIPEPTRPEAAEPPRPEAAKPPRPEAAPAPRPAAPAPVPVPVPPPAAAAPAPAGPLADPPPARPAPRPATSPAPAPAPSVVPAPAAPLAATQPAQAPAPAHPAPRPAQPLPAAAPPVPPPRMPAGPAPAAPVPAAATPATSPAIPAHRPAAAVPAPAPAPDPSAAPARTAADAFASLSAAMRGEPRPAPAAPRLLEETGSGPGAGAVSPALAAFLDRGPVAPTPRPAEAGPFRLLAEVGPPPAAQEASAAAPPAQFVAPSADAQPRLLADAALTRAREIPAGLAAVLAREAPEPAPGPSSVAPSSAIPSPAAPPSGTAPGALPPPSQVLGPMPELPAAPAPEESSTPTVALGSMVQALRVAPAPRPVPPAPEPVFSLLAGMRAAAEAPPPPPAPPRPAPPPEPAIPALTGRPIALPEGAGARLLSEASLSAGALPAGIAAILARPPESPEAAPRAPEPTSDVPLIQAGLRASAPRTPPAGSALAEWRLLQPEVLPGALPELLHGAPPPARGA
ncbi:glycosyltransferase [Pararoseomonas sp. SCSIO 73927]|uniref:glycosyltransferase n=1 Tax=Pararoseomonas sp. SCSIO 73927 TaxID=3114537 RepID=UPI0030CEB8B1